MGGGNVFGGGTGLNYLNNFSGTSAAAPQVAGVAGLLLSVDPTLTETEVRCRIQQTATDIGTFNFDNFYGFGRLNAYYCAAINNLDLIDATIAGLQNYATRDFITSGTGSEILPTATVNLIAGRAITLNPGFKTDLNCVFSATINTVGPCGTNAGGPFRLADSSTDSNQQEISIDDLIVINPNPAIYNVIISAKNKEIKIEKLLVNNLLNQKQVEVAVNATNSYMLDVSDYKSGIYFLLINTSQGQVVKKIIKQ
jgi:Subtilase family/Secretion system C-terminal sorting domain